MRHHVGVDALGASHRFPSLPLVVMGSPGRGWHHPGTDQRAATSKWGISECDVMSPLARASTYLESSAAVAASSTLPSTYLCTAAPMQLFKPSAATRPPAARSAARPACLRPRSGVRVAAGRNGNTGDGPWAELKDGAVTEGPDLSVTVNGIHFPNPFLRTRATASTRQSCYGIHRATHVA